MTTKVHKTMQRVQKQLRHVPSRTYTIAGVLAFAAVGTFLLVGSHAATSAANYEAEAGSTTAGAVVVADTGASGGSAVEFMAASGGSASCPAYPAFPDANCTGVPAGTTLNASGSLTVTTANAVIQNLDINGSVTVKASNVTIKNCKIHSTGSGPGVNVVSGNVIIRNTEIYGFADEAIGWDNWAGYNLNIHGMQDDGVKFGNNVTLQDSYVHDFTPAAGSHSDGGQLQGGLSNLTIRHNNINLPGANAAMLLAPDLGPNGAGPVVIDSNLLGGGNYTLYIVDGNNGQYHQKGYVVTNNHFVRNAQYGPLDIVEPASSFTAWSGNVWHDTGAVIGGP